MLSISRQISNAMQNLSFFSPCHSTFSKSKTLTQDTLSILTTNYVFIFLKLLMKHIYLADIPVIPLTWDVDLVVSCMAFRAFLIDVHGKGKLVNTDN